MAGKPIATLGSMHVCPMITGYIPHIGGPVSGPGAPNVLINGKPAALMGDICVCVGPPDTIAQGEPTVLINGTPVATMGSMTAHGGSIVMGEPNVMISSATPNAKATMPLKKIPFPEIRIIDRVGAMMRGKSAELKQAKANQEQIKKEAEEQEKEQRIYNLQWLNNDSNTNNGKIEKSITLSASVQGIDDGSEIIFTIYKNAENAGEEDVEIDKLTGKVQNYQVKADWTIDKDLLKPEENQQIMSEEVPLGQLYFTADYDK